MAKSGWCMSHGKPQHDHCRWDLCQCECHEEDAHAE